MTEPDITQLRFLVVDDEPFVLNLSTRILKNLGASDITTAANGARALEQLHQAEEGMDVVICDLNMPHMDGVQFTRHLAGMDFTGGVVFLSGEDESLLRAARQLAEAYHLNVLGAIPKPLKPESIQTMLASFRPEKRKPAGVAGEMLTEEEIVAGLADDRVLLSFQPKVALDTGAVTGAEVLARWDHPTQGILGPWAFVPVAEEAGSLIDDLTDHILVKALRQVADWMNRGIETRIAVNVVADSLTRVEFVDMLTGIAAVQGVDLSLLTLEMNESQIMKDVTRPLEVLTRLRMNKVELSINGFGTGYSSVEQLQRLPFTEIKSDRGFVTGAVQNDSTRAILESSVQLAQRLGLKTVAEGVETRAAWDLVRELGVNQAQGFYITEAMPPEDYPAWLDAHPRFKPPGE